MLNDGVPLILGIQLGLSADPEQRLGLLQCGLQAEAQADQPVPGGSPPPGEDLVQIDLAHAGAFGQGGLGDLLFPAKRGQLGCGGVRTELLLIFGQKLLQIGGFLYFLPKVVRILPQQNHTFTFQTLSINIAFSDIEIKNRFQRKIMPDTMQSAYCFWG